MLMILLPVPFNSFYADVKAAGTNLEGPLFKVNLQLTCVRSWVSAKSSMRPRRKACWEISAYSLKVAGPLKAQSPLR
jgi:hypothetical protein